MPGVFGGPVVTTRVLSTLAHEAAGAPCARHSPRPLKFGAKLSCTTRAHRAARSRSCGGKRCGRLKLKLVCAEGSLPGKNTRHAPTFRRPLSFGGATLGCPRAAASAPQARLR